MIRILETEVGLIYEDDDYPSKGRYQDQKDQRPYEKRDPKSRQNYYKRNDGYEERGYNESYYDYDGTQGGYGHKGSNTKREKGYHTKAPERYNEPYFIKKDNIRKEDENEYYIKVKPTTAEESKPAHAHTEKDQVKESTKQQHQGTDHKETKHEQEHQHTAKHHQPATQSSSQGHAQTSAKKRKYYEDDGSDNEEVYSALLNTQKPEASHASKKNTNEQPHHSHHNGPSKGESDNKTGLKAQTSNGSRGGHAGHHIQDKTDITPPPGIDQKSENPRGDSHTHTSPGDKDGRHQNSNSKNRDRNENYGTHLHSGSNHHKETDTKDHHAHLDARHNHGSQTNTHSFGHGTAPLTSGNSNVMISPQLSALPQVPTFFMAQQITTVGPDGHPSQQVMLVPMTMMQAPAPTSGLSHGTQIPGVPSGAPFMFAPHISQGQKPGHATEGHSHAGHGHNASHLASIYCLVPIHPLPYHPPHSN